MKSLSEVRRLLSTLGRISFMPLTDLPDPEKQASITHTTSGFERPPNFSFRYARDRAVRSFRLSREAS